MGVQRSDHVLSRICKCLRVVKFHVHESVLKDGRDEDEPLVDLKKLDAVGRAGDITYWPNGVEDSNTLPMGRPK